MQKETVANVSAFTEDANAKAMAHTFVLHVHDSRVHMLVCNTSGFLGRVHPPNLQDDKHPNTPPTVVLLNDTTVVLGDATTATVDEHRRSDTMALMQAENEQLKHNLAEAKRIIQGLAKAQVALDKQTKQP
jgi:hypothetical protein